MVFGWSLETNVVGIGGWIEHFSTRRIVDKRRHLFQSQYFKRMDKNLLSSWTKVLSKQRLLYYWFNSKTGQTQWEEEPSLNDSEYIDHFLTWVSGVILVRYTNPNQSLCIFGNLFPMLRRSITDVFTQLNALLPPQVNTSRQTKEFPPDVLFNQSRGVTGITEPFAPSSVNRTCDATEGKHVDQLFIPFMVHEMFETEYTTRTFFKFLYTSVNKHGIVWGLMLNQDFIQSIITGNDPYKRLWKNSHAKYKSQQKHIWSNDTHAISLGPTSDFIWRYGTANKSRGWTMSSQTFKRYCSDYKFEILTYSSVIDFYYKYANDFMAEFKQLVGYKLSYDTDWNSIHMYDVFVLRKM